ncbi:hypothetical protein BT63DRAFT_422776 [Microthyrium microscopicum]|uniref:Cyclase n=1 Tax=Microthyrium microscopicum TaxID=703497 RepID=A0A6A6UMH8_9PEZI|nr:hypothetical protein BT63DRAFT_422776 [Microthyrium microscopicum]
MSTNTASSRLSQLLSIFTPSKPATMPPWDPDSTSFPTRQNLPPHPIAPKGASWNWGATDQLGRLNLLTPARVLSARRTITTGQLIPLNLPLSVPATPSFNRRPFEHTIKAVAPGISYDDEYTLNTQSGTQWDGLRHFAHIPSGLFYNGAKGADIEAEGSDVCGMQAWAAHGIAGRGVLLDYWGYTIAHNKSYDAYAQHAISHADLVACGKWQGLDIRPASQGGDIQIGDMLFVRSGFNAAYASKTEEERTKLAKREGEALTYAGVEQSEEMLDWLHDAYFAAVAGDAPSFEVWPPKKDERAERKYYMHEYILALWGMPLGEMLDLEALAVACGKQKRYVFFFVSSPANVKGGVGSHVNGVAIL